MTMKKERKTSKPLKVVHLRDSGGLYGAERIILGSSQTLAQMGVEPRIVSILDSGEVGRLLLDAAEGLGLKADAFHADHTLDLSAMKRLKIRLQEWEADIVHVHDLRSAVFGLAGTRGLPVQTVATAHGSTCESWKKRVYLEIFERVLLPRYDRVHVVSPPLAEHLEEQKVPGERIRVIPNGVDPSVLQCPQGRNPLSGYKGNPTLCAVGRITEDKGLSFLLKAVASLKKDFPDMRLLLAGSGPQEKKFRGEVAQLGLEGLVHLCGAINPVAWVYDVADILILPSLREGLPCVIIETMLAGIPVVASEVGAIPEVLDQGRLGRLVPPGNVEALADGMRDVMTHADEFHGLAERAKDSAFRHYSAETMSIRLKKLYEEVIP